jgi:uncharacterized membrane protein
MPGFSCPNCGFEVANVPPAFSGKKVRCKKCSEVFQLPVFDASEEPIAAEVTDVAEPASPFNFNAGAGPAPSFSTSNYASPGTMAGGYRKKSNTAATVALCLGIASIVLFWVPIIGMLLCLAGIVTSIFGFLGAKKGNGGMGFSITGGVLSLLGIVVYIALIVLMFSSLGTIMDAVKKNQIEETRAEIADLEDLLDVYFLERGEYPDRLDKLVDAADEPEGILDSVFEDSWINPYQYKRLSNEKGGYQLWSRGPDEKSGTADDIHAKHGKGR